MGGRELIAKGTAFLPSENVIKFPVVMAAQL